MWCLGVSSNFAGIIDQRFLFGVFFVVLLVLCLTAKAVCLRLMHGPEVGWDIDFRARNFAVVLVSFVAAIYLSHQYICLCLPSQCNLWTNVLFDQDAKSMLIGLSVVCLMGLSFYIKHVIFDDSDDNPDDDDDDKA